MRSTSIEEIEVTFGSPSALQSYPKADVENTQPIDLKYADNYASTTITFIFLLYTS